MRTIITEADQVKLRGGYYTPFELAKWICIWAIRSKNDSVLEPSCGNGSFMEAAGLRLNELGANKRTIAKKIWGVELIASEANKARQRFASSLSVDIGNNIASSDLFEWLLANKDPRFDVVIGNPPFIRYQNFPEPSRSLAMNMMEREQLRPNKLTNIWVPFVVASVSRLKTGGRLAMVIPAEILQVSYAAQLRTFLVDRFQRIEIVSCNEMFFTNAEQEVVLLLAEGKLSTPSQSNRCIINMTEFNSVGELISSIPSLKNDNDKIIQHDSEKWLKYFLQPREIDFMRELRQSAIVTPLKTHAEVDVGVVTGKNQFFVVSSEEVEKYGLVNFTLPLVGRSAQLTGAIFRETDFKDLSNKKSKNFLFYVPPKFDKELPAPILDYIRLGEKNNFHTGYKCSIRKPWYTVPTVWNPNCFLFRQIYDFPRIVANKTSATSTDTIHRLTCKSNPTDFVPSTYTYLTGASAEIEGRSYGGGVLELEPTEAERVLTPTNLGKALSLEAIDELVRKNQLEQALDENSRLILKDSLGFSITECKTLKNIWERMKSRRLQRGKSKRAKQ